MSVNRNKNALQKKISTHFGRLGRGHRELLDGRLRGQIVTI